MIRLALALALALCFCCVLAAAQGVTERSYGLPSLRRAGDAAAEDAKRTDWPMVKDEGSGTQVHITFDFNNCDIILMTYPPPDKAVMLGEARRIAAELGYSNSDYYVYAVKTYFPIDIELNRYLERRDKFHAMTLDLEKLARVLASSKVLARPIVIRVEGDDADRTVLTTPSGAPKELGPSTFFGLREVPPGAKVQFEAALDWQSYAGAAILALLIAGVGAKIVSLPWQTEKARRQRIHAQEEGPVPDPEEVQRKYDKANPWLLLRPVLPGFFFLMMVFDKTMFVKAVRLIPDLPGDPRMTLLIPLGALLTLWLLGHGVYQLDKRRRMKNDPFLALRHPVVMEEDEAAGLSRLLPLMMIPAGLMVGVFFIPAVRNLSSGYRSLVVAGVVVLSVAFIAFVTERSLKRMRPQLAPGDPCYDWADEFGAQAGVKVREVQVIKDKTCNAFVSPFGTVSVTQGLLDKCEPEEVRCVIAHEIGHMQARHLKKLIPLSLAISAATIGVFGYLSTAYGDQLPRPMRILLSTPFVLILLLPVLRMLFIGKRQRQYETEADRFAVKAIGDPELVIRTLTKMNTLNGQPYRLKKSHEALSSHPSLVNRIKAIRDEFGSPEPS